jgi:hypothetical protein
MNGVAIYDKKDPDRSVVEVNLVGRSVTDIELKELAGISAELERLNLDGTKVMDAGLNELARFKGLKKLDLRNTQVTVDGVARLRELLPRCLIEHNSQK